MKDLQSLRDQLKYIKV